MRTPTFSITVRTHQNACRKKTLLAKWMYVTEKNKENNNVSHCKRRPKTKRVSKSKFPLAPEHLKAKAQLQLDVYTATEEFSSLTFFALKNLSFTRLTK
ncbi:hypothetical protein TNCV_3829521 [Trichonephila clavipes]|nr:hypothetical protein TNCV_3829521 [Trichonephila clavipes]